MYALIEKLLTDTDLPKEKRMIDLEVNSNDTHGVIDDKISGDIQARYPLTAHSCRYGKYI